MVQPAKDLANNHNLPLQLTPLIGRSADLEAIAARLADPGCRLLSLVGPGGMGKTRLALQVASDVRQQFRDGVWFVELADLSDPALVAQAVSSTLGLKQTPERSLTETLVAYLDTRHLLLVLDNCEHLLDSSSQLAHALLSACSELCLMVTSREALHIPGELAWQVPPLTLPDVKHSPVVDDALQSEAVQLFLDRAVEAYPAFSLTRENAPIIAQVCLRLDGLPLAIELAAARVKVLSMAQIAERLDDRFRLLAGGDRTAPPRHQALQSTLDWSYDLLTDQGQSLFRRLSVFSGSFNLGAAEAICSANGVDQTEILDLLGGLVDKSLVVVQGRDGFERRYRLLETVRQYARQKLDDAGEAAAFNERHVAWFLAVAEQADPLLLWGAADAAFTRQLEVEQSNLRAALQRSSESGWTEQSLRLATALTWYWYVRALPREGRYWLEKAIAASQGSLKAYEAYALNAAGSLAALQGKYEEATALLKDALALDCEQKCSNLAAWSLLELGVAALFGGDYTTADHQLEESLSFFREQNDSAGITSVLLYQGITAGSQGDHQRARTLIQESLPSLRELGDVVGIVRGLYALGAIARHEDDLEGSAALFRQGLQVAWDKGARLEFAHCLEGLAGVTCVQGNHPRASRLFGAAEALRQEIGAVLPCGSRTDHDQDLARVRAQADDGAFAAAWQAGRDMPLEQVLALALTGPDPAARAAEPDLGSRPLTPLQAAKRRYGGLTARERQVAALVARGRSNAAIAEELVVTLRTVEAHVTHILRKLGFSSRTQVAAWAIDRGLARPPRTLGERMLDG